MQQLLIYFFIAIGLSMDAFSLAIAYGTNNIEKKKILILSKSVGLFHFFMPVLGSLIGQKMNYLVTDANKVVAIILFIIAIQMYMSRKEEKKGSITNILSIILFSLTVSLDSFSVGLGLGLMKKTIFSASTIFSITSFIFTLIGLILGKKLSERFGLKATYLGIIILIVIAIKYLVT